MQQLFRLWNSLTLTQRISLVVVPLLVCLGAWGLTRYRHESSFRILYGSLAPDDAASVTQKIREAGIEYHLDESGATVSVPASKLAEARMALAAAGIPRTGRSGFELFDGTSIATSDFGENVKYHRALEGELERTVGTLAEVAQARIHLTFPKESVFLDSQKPAKATVVLQLKRSARISQQNILAIANLVASAVDGLNPEAVAIVDTNSRLLNRPNSGEESGVRLAAADYEYRTQVEANYLARINAALEPVLGADRFRAGVNVDLDFSSSEENNETYDPSGSVMLTTQSTEESNATSQPSGTPGTASNLPRPTGRSGSGSSGTSRRTESHSFQPSRTVRHVVSARGAVRRISTAVVVDQAVRWEGTGVKARRVLMPPSAEVLKSVQSIIAGITGFSETRGDQITVESVPFESTLSTQPPPGPIAPVAPPKPVNIKDLVTKPQFIGGGTGAVVLLLGGGYWLLRRRKTSKAIAKAVATASDTAPGALSAADGVQVPPQLSAEQKMEARMAQAHAEQERAEAEALSRIALPVATDRTDILVKHIRESISKDPSASAGILRAWLADKEGRKA